ncbi:MAG: WavE lipopolysaccharide synthesis [Gemmatimonadetes bacterium]|nr:WavE lipopolysaccharide synthesis [Gemmatimonadota bacterium]
MKIAPPDISIVVQGPISGTPSDSAVARLTLRCLESVRRQLPGAEIILSTWKGSDLSGLPFDTVIENDDPGALRLDDMLRSHIQFYYNANRQIVSTRNGLRAATRPYAMKLRSDMILTGTGFLSLFGRYEKRAADWSILRARVIASTFFSRNPRKRYPYAFHPSDWFHFGYLEDVSDLWEIPLAGDEIPRWFETHPRPAGDTEAWAMYRYTVEQYIWTAFLRKHGPVHFDHKRDTSNSAVALSELTIANNLVLGEVRMLGLEFPKYPVSLANQVTLYTHAEWQQLYQRYCDPAFRPAVNIEAASRRARFAAESAREFFLSPRNTRIGRTLSTGVERRFPRSFRLMKRSYSSLVNSFASRVRG